MHNIMLYEKNWSCDSYYFLYLQSSSFLLRMTDEVQYSFLMIHRFLFYL